MRQILTALLLIISLLPQTSLAVANKDQKSYVNGTEFYDDSDAVACSDTASTTVLSGNDNIEKVFNFYIGKGLTPAQTSGIIGNYITESNVNPTTKQKDGGAGRGIAQWSVDGRWKGVIALAQKTGRSEWDLDLQLDYSWKELTEDYNGSFTALKAITRNDSAAALAAGQSFGRLYEQFGVNGDRDQNAIDTFAQYGGGGATGGEVAASAGAASCGGGAAAGTGTVDATGYAFPVGPQRKSINGGVAALSPLPCTGGPNSCHHDNTPAFDLGRQPGSDGSAGAAVYAIHDGTIDSLRIYHGIEGCYAIQFKATDSWYYWYGHLSNPTVAENATVTAGQQIGEIGRRACTGNGSTPHLHIDRGCDHKPGGRDSCRDPGFIPLINTLFENLPD